MVLKLLLRINNPKKLEEREKDREWTKIWQNSLESVEDPRMWFSSWFLNDAKFEDISLEDAKDFVTWAMYQNVPESLNDKELFELNKSISQIEIFANHKFPLRGDKKPLISMRTSLETFKGYHKPLAFYLITQGLFGKVMEKDLKLNGFISDTTISPFRYFIKKPMDNDDAFYPIVFIHGVGGLPAYLKLIKSVISKISPKYPFILVEMPYVSLHVSPTVPSVDDHVEFVRKVLHKNGYSKGIFIGHSWGSNIVSWLVQSDHSIISTAIFLDPVCFMLQLRGLYYYYYYYYYYYIHIIYRYYVQLVL